LFDGESSLVVWLDAREKLYLAPPDRFSEMAIGGLSGISHPEPIKERAALM